MKLKDLRLVRFVVNIFYQTCTSDRSLILFIDYLYVLYHLVWIDCETVSSLRFFFLVFTYALTHSFVCILLFNAIFHEFAWPNKKWQSPQIQIEQTQMNSHPLQNWKWSYSKRMLLIFCIARYQQENSSPTILSDCTGTKWKYSKKGKQTKMSNYKISKLNQLYLQK